jgi:hypothetical protein
MTRKTPIQPRLVRLDIYNFNRWQQTLWMDINFCDDGTLEHAADQLLRLSWKAIKARIVSEDGGVLLIWTQRDGWREVENADEAA